MADDADETTDRESEPPDSPPGDRPRTPIVPDDEELVFDQYVQVHELDELVFTLVETVANVRGTEIEELLPTVQESIDVDALRHVFGFRPETPYRSGWVTFFFGGCRIVLDSDHRLQIYDRRTNGP
jgi:hypothetical protein